jgi:PAS domain S-box-containing protein
MGVCEDIGFALYGMKVEEERKKQEVVIRESEERFRIIFDSALDGILLADPENRRFHLGNRTMCRMLGCSPDEITRLGVDDIHPRDDLPRVIADFEAQARQEKTLSTDIPVKRKDGSVFYADVNTAPITLHGKTYMMGIFRDATERRRMQVSLAQADRLASVGMLAAGVAHEINNPLTYVLYNLDGLVRDLEAISHADTRGDRTVPGPAEIDSLLERAREAAGGAQRVRDIVKDLKTFSRVDEERVVPVYLSQVLETAINMAFNEIKYRAQLIKEYEPAPPVMANDGRLSQVFLNLLVNAAQAIDEGDSENNRIRVRTWSEGGEALAEVSDTGKGIAPANLARIFDPFYTTKPAGLGSGLGLPISNKIISDYGGRIEVQSEPGKGTRFMVHLPLQSGTEPRASTPAAEKKSGSTGPRGRVMVVDDEPILGRSMKRMLEKEHEVLVQTSGEQARETLERDREFDVILCDLMMPAVTGMDLYAWLHDNQPDLARRMVFLTGGAFTPRAREFLQRVPNARFEKPAEMKNLQEIVRNLVAGRRVARR